MSTWGGGGGKRVGARTREEQVREEGASSPFYSESGTPGCCQVTVGQSLEEMPTLSVTDKEYTNSMQDCSCNSY